MGLHRPLSLCLTFEGKCLFDRGWHSKEWSILLREFLCYDSIVQNFVHISGFLQSLLEAVSDNKITVTVHESGSLYVRPHHSL